MPPKRMTANPVRPARYRPGKPTAEEVSSEEESGAEDEEAEEQPQQPQAHAPPPKATSFPAGVNLKNLDLNERRKQAEAQERIRQDRERAERARLEKEAGFVTESSDEDSADEASDAEPAHPDSLTLGRPAPQRKPRAAAASSEEDSSSEESSSSEDDKPALLRPVFIRKDKRAAATPATSTPNPDTTAQRRQEQTDALVRDKLALDAAARAAGKKAWDDDDPDIEGAVDDTDGLDPELERQQWVARELARLKRSRALLEEREAELAEIERRRGLSAAEREEEDRAHIEAQKAEREGRGKAGFMARYHHRGAFMGAANEAGEDDTRARELAERDLMGAQYEGQEGMRETLPEFLQVRDQTKIGRKGRTKYKDLRNEDTGRWGDLGRGGRGGAAGGQKGFGDKYAEDERFRPDRPGDRDDFAGGTGANAGAVGERKRTYGDDRGSDYKRPRYEDDRR